MPSRAGAEPRLRFREPPGAHRSLGRSFAAIARYESDSRVGRCAMTAPRLALAYALDLLLGDPEWLPHPVRGFGVLIRTGERWLRRLGRGRGRELTAGAALTSAVASIGWAMGRPKNATPQVLLAWMALA